MYLILTRYEIYTSNREDVQQVHTTTCINMKHYAIIFFKDGQLGKQIKQMERCTRQSFKNKQQSFYVRDEMIYWIHLKHLFSQFIAVFLKVGFIPLFSQLLNISSAVAFHTDTDCDIHDTYQIILPIQTIASTCIWMQENRGGGRKMPQK